MAASRAHASLREACASAYASVTGLRVRVYFAPFKEALCSSSLRAMSVVTPVYKEPSAHEST